MSCHGQVAWASVSQSEHKICFGVWSLGVWRTDRVQAYRSTVASATGGDESAAVSDGMCGSSTTACVPGSTHDRRLSRQTIHRLAPAGRAGAGCDHQLPITRSKVCRRGPRAVCDGVDAGLPSRGQQPTPRSAPDGQPLIARQHLQSCLHLRFLRLQLALQLARLRLRLRRGIQRNELHMAVLL